MGVFLLVPVLVLILVTNRNTRDIEDDHDQADPFFGNKRCSNDFAH
jgi:hypothetical protein